MILVGTPTLSEYQTEHYKNALDKSTISNDRLNADMAQKSTTSQGRVFHTLMTRSVKNSDLAVYCYVDFVLVVYVSRCFIEQVVSYCMSECFVSVSVQSMASKDAR